MVAQWLGLSESINSGRSSVRGLAVFPHGHGLNQDIRQFVGLGFRAGFIPLNDRDVYWFLNRYSPPKGWHLQFYNAENDRKKGGGKNS